MAVLARRAAAYGSRAPDPGLYNPLTAMSWESAIWADDPAQPKTSTPLTSWRGGGRNGGRFTFTGTGTIVWVPTDGVLNNRGAFVCSVAAGFLGPTTSIPSGQWAAIQIGYTPSIPSTEVSLTSGAVPFGTATTSGSYWGIVISGQASSRGRVWAFNPGGGFTGSGITADTKAHLIRVYQNNSNQKTTMSLDEGFYGGDFGGAALVNTQNLRINLFGNGNSSAATTTAFAGLYRYVNTTGITSDPGWLAFKAWARSYYGLVIG